MTINKITEQDSLYENLDTMDTKMLLENINQEDQKVALAVQKAIPQMEELIEKTLPKMKNGGRMFYLGAGTSGRLGVLDASELPPTFGVPPTIVIGLIAGGDHALRNPVEGAEDDTAQAWKDLQAHDIQPNDTVVGIAASGTTPYVIGGCQKAREEGLLTSCITMNPEAPVISAVDIPIVAVVGPEFVTGSTRMKSGTAQKLILNMITTTLMIRLGKVEGNKMVNMQLANQKLVERGTQMLVQQLSLSYDEAKKLLLEHGSVKKALVAYANN